MRPKVKSRGLARRSDAPRLKSKLGSMTVMMVSGDPVTALRGVSLPAGAKVAVIATNREAVEKLKRSGKKRFKLLQKGYVPVTRSKGAAAAAVNRDAFKPDARARALLQGVRTAQEDLRSSGGAYDLAEVRTLLRGISRQAVDKRVREGSLLAVPGPSNRRSFPTLQFTRDGRIVEGLKSVQEALPSRNPWTILNFLTHPDDRLNGCKPIDVLKQGQVGLVVEAALRMGQQGA